MGLKCEQEIVYELVGKLLEAGFRPFIAKSGTYGFYTDKEGSGVVCFQCDGFLGLTFGGSYRAKKSTDARYVGTGWRMDESPLTHEGLKSMFNQRPPRWAVGDIEVHRTTLDEHLASYGKSSGYTEVSVDAISRVEA